MKTIVAAAVVVCMASMGSGLAAERVSGDAEVLVGGNTAFALDLYGKLKEEKGNLFLSPYSISTALAMTYSGARAETKAQMWKALRFPPEGFLVARPGPATASPINPEILAGTFAELEKALKADPKTAGYELHVANALWGRAGHKFLDSFLNVTKDNYGAGLTALPFRTDPDGARKTINKWVEDQTKDKIKELLKEGVITPDTALVLTNAIYFKGDWAVQFDKKKTADAVFHVAAPKAGAEEPVVRLMERQGHFGYAEQDGVQVLELPYRGERLSMFVLLPKWTHEAGDPAAAAAGVENALTVEKLKGWTAAVRTQEVRVLLPKFTMTCEFDLCKALASLGMTDAFKSDAADFTGMRAEAKGEGLFISAVVHKAFVEVNEEGTEAAAATAVVMKDEAEPAPPPVFRADHPFVFFIRDNRTGSVLFMGRVMNPKQ